MWRLHAAISSPEQGLREDVKCAICAFARGAREEKIDTPAAAFTISGLTTEYFSYREWLRVGPDEATATGSFAQAMRLGAKSRPSSGFPEGGEDKKNLHA
jgi:hypothetical protein